MNTCIATSIYKKKPYRGFSLFELLIAMSIFTVIAVPLLSLPLKAQDIQESAENVNVSNFEINNNFSQSLGDDIKQSSHFFPVPNMAGFNPSKQLFLASYDSNSRQEKRVGYAIRTVDGHTNLYKAEIGPFADLADYSLGSENWQPVSVMDESLEGTFFADDSGDVRFIYCQAKKCSASVTPDNATAVILGELTSGVSGAGNISSFNYVYQTNSLEIPPLYYRLASSKGNNFEDDSIYPFSLVRGAQTILPTNKTETDIYFNNKTQEFLFATQTTGANPIYEVYKWGLGVRSYKGYESYINSSLSSASYFPIRLASGDPGYPGPGWTFNSVTQDDEGAIFVLASKVPSFGVAYQARVIKFGVDGTYIKHFDLSPEVINNAIAITFNPNTPREINIFVKNRAGQYVIQSYLKDLHYPDSQLVRPTAESVSLNNPDIMGTFDIQSVNGIEYVPDIDAYLLSSGSGELGSFSPQTDIHREIDELKFKPADRMFLIEKIIGLDGTQIEGFGGIAYDDVHNQFFALASEGQSVQLLSITPNVNLRKRI